MKKTVIFVEGQTELIFVREYLLKWFEWQVDLECTKLLFALQLWRQKLGF